MSVRFESHVFIPDGTDFRWETVPRLLAETFPGAALTVDADPGRGGTPRSATATLADGYDISVTAITDGREFAADALHRLELPADVAQQLRVASETCWTRIEISADNDMFGDDDHHTDAILATQAFEGLPGAVGVDGALLDLAPRRPAEPPAVSERPRRWPWSKRTPR